VVHSNVGAQVRPQPPQSSASVVMSTQAPPQDAFGAMQEPFVQSPLAQTSSAAHRRPQAPQFVALASVSTHCPPHDVRPGGHAHAPPAQTQPDTHVVPQAPQ
jgi:hypothetical protein